MRSADHFANVFTFGILRPHEKFLVVIDDDMIQLPAAPLTVFLYYPLFPFWSQVKFDKLPTNFAFFIFYSKTGPNFPRA